MKNSYLIIGGLVIFALGLASGTILLPARHQAAANAAVAGIAGSRRDSETIDSAQMGGDDAIPADFGSRLENALHGESERTRNRAFATIADGMTPDQIKAALGTVQKIASSDQRSKVLDALLDQWTSKDPNAATAYVMALPKDGYREDAIAATAGSWARSDLKSAKAWAIGLGDVKSERAAVMGIITGIAPSDPEAALKLVTIIPDDKYGAVDSVFDPIAENDPQRAIALLGTLTDRSSRVEAVIEVAKVWGKQNPAAASAWALKLSNGEEREQAIENLTSSWVASDPKAATTFVWQLPPGPDRERLLENSMYDWGREDDASAETWLQQIPAGTVKDELIHQVVITIGADRPQRLLELISMMEPGRRQDEDITNEAGNLVGKDPSAAVEWAKEQTPHVQGLLWPGIAGALADSDPKAAMNLISTLPKDSDALNRVMETWCEKDPDSAAAYIAKMPEGDEKVQSADAFVVLWMHNDSPAATRWINSMPAGPTKSKAEEDGASDLSQWDPAGAIKLLATDNNDEQRQSEETRIAGNWLRSDSAAAAAWIQTSDLPPETKLQLLQSKQ